MPIEQIYSIIVLFMIRFLRSVAVRRPIKLYMYN